MLSKVAKTQKNIARCLCLNCPSYSSVCKIKNAHQNNNLETETLEKKTHYEKMFCAFEKSNCIHFNRGCLCEQCLNFHDYNLDKCEYCRHTGGANTCINLS